MIVEVERPVRLPSGLPVGVAGISLGALRTAGTVVEMPDHAVTLAVRTRPDLPTELVAMGPRTRAMYVDGEVGPSCLKVRLEPGLATAVFGHSPADLVDQAKVLTELPTSRRGPMDQLETVLTMISGARPALSVDLVERAARLLGVGVRVQEVARRLHVSERHLRDVFTAATGLSPKHYARIHRVRTVLAQSRNTTHPRDIAQTEDGGASGAGRGGLAEVAVAVGYYDQSHLTAEFRRVMGVPPHAFATGKLPRARMSADA